MLRVSLFGEFVLEDEKGKALKISTRKAQLLLAYLLLRSEHAHPRERLIDLFWPEFSEERGKQSLRQAVYALRNILEPDESSRGTYLNATPQAVQFNSAGPIEVDAVQFEKLLKASERVSAHDEKAELLYKAVDLYKGDLLVGCYDDWCLEDREHLRARYLNALKILIQYLAQQKEYEKAISYAQQSLKHDPFQEPVHYQLISLYAASGDRSAALKQYQDCEQVLKKELGVEPLPETQSLYQELQKRSAAPLMEQIAERASTPKLELGAPFVNREQELEMLMGALKQAHAGNGKALWISGEAGIGKSRLIQEFLSHAARQKSVILKSRCYDIEGRLPFQSVIEAIRTALNKIPKTRIEKISERALREVVKLVPELEDFVKNVQPSSPLSSPDQERNRLFEGLRQFLASLSEAQPLILFLDDLHWADESTFGFIHYFARQVQEKNILFLGSYREEEVDEDHPLWPIIQHLIRDHLAEEVRLGPFGESHVQELVHGLLDTKSLDQFGRQIFEDSKGFPFFVEELVKSSIEDGTLSFEDDSGDWQVHESRPTPQGVPSTVKALVGTRLRRVSPSGRQYLDLAAVSGHSFSPTLMTQTLGERKGESLASIGELLDRRFLEEQNEKYLFRHDVIRQVVYEKIQPERRRLLHVQVGEALETLHSKTKIENGVLGDLVLHFFNGQKWKKALQYALAAGQQAWQKHYAKEEALRFFRQALNLAEKLDDKQNIMRAYKGMGEVCATTDEQDAGLDYCLKALELATEHEERAEIYGYIASVHHNKLNIEVGLEYCERGLEELGSKKTGLIAGKLYHQAASFLNWMRRFDGAIEYCAMALEALKSLNNPVITANTLSFLGQAYSGKGDYASAVEHLAMAVKQAEKTDDPYSIGLAYFQLGIAYLDLVKPTEAVQSWNASLNSMEHLSGRYSDVTSIHNRLVQGYLLINDLDAAYVSAKKQLQSAELSGNPEFVALSAGMLGCVLDLRGNQTESNQYYDKALSIAPQSAHVMYSIIISYLYAGQLAMAVRWFERGHQHLKVRDIEKLQASPALNVAMEEFRNNPLFKERVLLLHIKSTPPSGNTAG